MKPTKFNLGTNVSNALIIHENRRVPNPHMIQPHTKLGQQTQTVCWLPYEEPLFEDPNSLEVTYNLQKPHQPVNISVLSDFKTNSDSQASCKDDVLLQVQQNSEQVSLGWENELNSALETNDAIEINNFMEEHYAVTQDRYELGHTQLMLKLTNSSRTTTRF